ncbi:MAG: hypothetical protein R2770_02250 [Acidimicrobiales bacterium]|nr:hypothetical protein [Acidimicrobiales bacterium]
MANRQKDKRSSNTLGDYATGADTLIGATQAAREAGFDGSMRSLSNGRVACSTCSAEYSASQYEAIFEHRLEGASDVADMLILIAGRCPRCATKSNLVLGYGPNASPEDADVLERLDLSGATALETAD